MKSPGSNYSAPKSWQPDKEMMTGQGQVAQAPQQQTPSFLPDDPTQMATGLTPEMVALILGMQPPTVQSAGGQPQQAQQGRAQLAQMLAPQGGQILG